LNSHLPLLFLIVLSACAEGPVRRSYSESLPPPGAPAKSEALKKAQSYYSTGEYGNSLTALGLIEEEKLLPSEKTEYWNLKGLIRLADKNYPNAVLDFKKAVSVNTVPDYDGYYQYNLATAWFEMGRKDDAKKTLDGIKLETMSGPEQKKVLILREKLARGTPTKALPRAPEPSAPLETYAGAANADRIGLLLPLSGKYENFGKKVQRSIELAIQTSTDPRAKTLEIRVADAGETPESNLEALKHLIEVDQVIGVIGPVLSKPIDSMKAKFEFYQTAVLSLAQTQGASSPHLFSCSVSVKDQVAGIVDFAMSKKNLKRFAVLAPDNRAGTEMAHAFWDEVTDRKGEIRGFELYDPDLTDFREPTDKILGLHYTETRAKELQELADKRKEMNITKKTMKTIQYFNLPPITDFDAIFIADEARTVGQIIPTFAYRDAKNLQFFGISSWNSSQLTQRAGDLVEGAVFPVAFNTMNPPEETKRFFDLYSQAYASNPGELDAVAFDAAAVVVKVMAQNPTTRADFTRILDGMSAVEGATGMIRMTERRCGRKLSLYSVKKGQFEVLHLQD